MEDLVLGIQIAGLGCFLWFCVSILRRLFFDDQLETLFRDLDSWIPAIRDQALSKLLVEPEYDPMEGGFTPPRAMPGFSSRAAPRLLSALSRCSDPIFRGRVARAIGELGLPQGAAPLAKALEDDRHPETRRGIAEGLARLRGKIAISALIKALRQDPHPEVRQHVANLLGDLNNRDALESLTSAATGDVHPGVRAAAANAHRKLSAGLVPPK